MVTIIFKDARDVLKIAHATEAEFSDTRISDGNLVVKSGYHPIAEFKRDDVVGFVISDDPT